MLKVETRATAGSSSIHMSGILPGSCVGKIHEIFRHFSKWPALSTPGLSNGHVLSGLFCRKRRGFSSIETNLGQLDCENIVKLKITYLLRVHWTHRGSRTFNDGCTNTTCSNNFTSIEKNNIF